MRLLTMLLVVALLVAAPIVYANGSGKVTTPPPVVVTPEGSGPVAPPEIVPEVTPPVVEPPMVQPPAPVGTGSICPPMTIPTPPSDQEMSADVEAFNTNLVVCAYNVSAQDVAALRQNGWTWGDINFMSQISSKTRLPLVTVATLRSQGMSWTDIACRYNLTAQDLTNPTMVTTRVAGYTTEYSYAPIYYRTDPWGNPVLSRYDAVRLSRMGYTWQNIAVATNIAAQTGASVQDVLAWTDRGYTWPQIAREYGVDQCDVMDVSRFPFQANCGAKPPCPEVCPPVETAPVGAGPAVCPGPPACPGPPTCPTHCGCPAKPSCPCGAGPAVVTPSVPTVPIY